MPCLLARGTTAFDLYRRSTYIRTYIVEALVKVASLSVTWSEGTLAPGHADHARAQGYRGERGWRARA